MIATYDDLTPAALAALGFDDPAQACRTLQGMAGHDVPDAAFDGFLRVLAAALERCADPDRAVSNLGRWAEAVGSRASAYSLLAGYPAAAEMLVTVFAASQFFADLLIQTPEYLEVLTNPRIRDRGRDADALWADLSRRVGIMQTPNARRDALRRFKPPEILRIGARDLLGFASMLETARAISDFADVCVRMALQICTEERKWTAPPFAVFALGKLGGQELNYASDIDLIFVHGEAMPTAEANKLGEAVRDALARATDAGFVFRVDLRLRPEGRFGPVSRSLEACRAYYESWAEPWERQALLKARFVAGDAAVGAAFAAMAEAFVYQGRVEETFVQSIQNNKRRLEQKIARAGESEINVKEGVGGIRDIEFTVQLMQLIAGGAKPPLRGGNTLHALDALADEGLLTAEERDTLRDSYVFLRTAEHRLQIRDELPVRCLPREAGELRKFGRRLGYADGEAFLTDYRRHTARVNALFERLFYGAGAGSAVVTAEPISDWILSPDDPAAQKSLRQALAERGFADVAAALDLLRRDVSGSEYGGIPPEARAAFAALLPRLLDGAAQTDDPDAALRGLDSLADAVPSRAALYQTLSESSSLLPRLCLLASGSPPLWQTLLSHLELLDGLADEEAMDELPNVGSFGGPPAHPNKTPILGSRKKTDQKRTRTSPSSPTPAPQNWGFIGVGGGASLAAQARRARLKTAARDLWGLADTAQVFAETTQFAEATLAGALEIARQETGFTGRFAVIGLGKLGGGELGYGSDWDVLYVADLGELAHAARLAERTQRLLRDDLAPYGVRAEMDARLRPEGRKGQLVLDTESYRAYYAQSAATWERQALLKARFVGGDPALGQEFAALAESVVYGQPLTDGQTEEIRAMKRRIETERANGPSDLKLGHGGLADIEWTAQLLQLRHGLRRPCLRVTGTLDALRRLRDDALLTQADWETLSQTYLHLARLRNRLWLKSGVPTDAPPALPDALRRQMAAVQEVCLRVFYGE